MDSKFFQYMLNILTFSETDEEYNARVVAKYAPSDDVLVATVKVPLALRGDHEFETAVYHYEYALPSPVIVGAYHTIEEAQRGHKVWLEKMTGPLLPDELVDVSSDPAVNALRDSLGGRVAFQRKSA